MKTRCRGSSTQRENPVHSGEGANPLLKSILTRSNKGPDSLVYHRLEVCL